MIVYIAYLLIGSSIFLAAFYYNIHRNREREDLEPLDYEPGISVLMPAYNEERVVEESLENILDLDYDNYEVIFVDDGSSDTTLEKASQFSDNKRLTVIEHDQNKGKAAALNTALEKADNKYSVVLDADSVIDTKLLRDAVTKIERKDNLGAVIASIMPLSEDSFVRRLQVVEYRLTNFYRSLMTQIDTLDVTPGAFSIYRTSDLREVGGFDRNNPTEDLEMAWQIRKKGRSLDMVYETRSMTELPQNFRELYDQRVRWARGFMYNARKHRDIFFNKEHGWFGRFQLPLHVIIPFISIIGLFMVLYGFFESIYNFLVKTSAVGIVLPTFESINFSRFLLGVQWKIYIPLGLSLIFTAFIIRVAYLEAGKEVRNRASLVFYFLAFFAIKASFWTVALLKEIFQSERIWK